MWDLKSRLKEGADIKTAYEETKRRCRNRQVQMEKAAHFIRDHDPDYERELMEKARQYRDGMLVLCGTMGKPYFVGNPPRWKENPLGDNEFVWQLNRMEHWTTLIRAFYLSGDVGYALKVLTELEDWIRTCPAPEILLDPKAAKERFSGVHPWRTLELGYRNFGSWNDCLECLICLPQFTQSLFEDFVTSLCQQADILYQVCPVLWPGADHNHYLTECMGLLEISGTVPFVADSDAWVEHGLRELERCGKVQITEEGGQIEGCPTYHHECLKNFTKSLRIMEKYGMKCSDSYKKRIRSMFRYSLWSTRPDGCSVPWGDSDAKPDIYEAAYCMYQAFGDKEYLDVCACVYGRDGLRKCLRRLVWEMKEPETWMEDMAFEELDTSLKPSSHIWWNRPLKQVMIRTGWEKSDASLFFACRTPIHNDHAHIDPNGFDYCNRGVPVLVDPGRYHYQEGWVRRRFKGGSYHNTLLMDNRDAFEYLGTWLYGRQEIGDILSVGEDGGWFYVCGSHANYFPVIHTRMAALNRDMLVILDRVDHRDKRSVDIYYNLNTPEAEKRQQKITARIEGNRVLFACSDNLECSLLRGQASREIDQADETTIIHLRNQDHCEVFASVFYMGGEDFVDLTISEAVMDRCELVCRTGATAYEITWNYKKDQIHIQGLER